MSVTLKPAVKEFYAEDGTKFAGKTLSSGSVTSKAISVLGCDKKTIYFIADQSGTLAIQVLSPTGNWRTYDTASISANALATYTMTGSARLIRITFTPSSYPCTIGDAWIVLE